ncbi:MAG TPA: amidohydrolase family protein [Caulobacter sp.]|nr:amidohydrolase family protein [Caulobacter sp.]
MPYVEGQTVHDADAHVMELPGTIERYADPAWRDALAARLNRPSRDEAWVERAIALQRDPEFRAGQVENLLLRKNHQALGAFDREDRPLAVDLLGFASQLVFTTTGLSLFQLEQEDDPALAVEAARAHNRMMVDFCAVDRRLLPTGYVPLVDRARAAEVAREAIGLGCKGLMIPSQVPRGHSPSHADFDALWATAQDAGLPILFHVGGEQKINPAYFNTGGPQVLDFHGGAENFTSVSFMAIPVSIWQTLPVLVFDGVFDRFPDLKFGAIELGAGWLPSLMQFMDSGAMAFGREERLQRLSAPPSDILRRQFFATPYPHENVGWIIDNVGEDMCLFSSDFPHVEGGRNPLKRFNESLEGVSATGRRKFFRDNFIALMGQGLAAELHDLPGLAAA